MTYSAINICSAALIKLGARSISSFEEGTVEAEFSSKMYPMVRDALLSSYPWSFAVCQTKLNRLSLEPVADYKYSYALPNDFLRVISAGNGSKGAGIEYRIMERRIHTNSDGVILTYIFRPEEENFPPFFYEALVSRLAAELCLPLTENTSAAQELLRRAENVISSARLIDAQQATPRKVEDFTLLGARR